MIASAGIELDAAISISGDYETTLSKMANKRLRVKLGRRRSVATSKGGSISVALDLGSRLAKVHGALSKGMGAGTALLEKLQTEFSLTDDFTALLRKELTSVSSSDDWQKFVDALLSSDASDAYLQSVRDKLSTDAAEKLGSLEEQIAGAASSALEDKISALELIRKDQRVYCGPDR